MPTFLPNSRLMRLLCLMMCKFINIEIKRYWILDWWISNNVKQKILKRNLNWRVSKLFSNSRFYFDDNFYLHIKGKAVGIRATLIYATLVHVMRFLEEKLYDQTVPLDTFDKDLFAIIWKNISTTSLFLELNRGRSSNIPCYDDKASWINTIYDGNARHRITVLYLISIKPTGILSRIFSAKKLTRWMCNAREFSISTLGNFRHKENDEHSPFVVRYNPRNHNILETAKTFPPF